MRFQSVPLMAIALVCSTEGALAASEPSLPFETSFPGALAPGSVIPGQRLDAARIQVSGVVTWEDMKAFEKANPWPPAGLSEFVPIHPIRRPAPTSGRMPTDSAVRGGGGTAPTLGMSFKGADRFDARLRPPDTMGAIGPRHFMEVINGNVSVFDRFSGYRLSSVSLTSFFAAVHVSDIPFDPRVLLFDHSSGRWVAMSVDCRNCTPNYVLMAVSRSDDPHGEWFQFRVTAEGFADYPTLGVDANGIYVAASIANQIWAFEKAPLVQDPPFVGVVTEWNVPISGALQPAHTYGPAPAEYFVQISSSTSLEIYAIQGPLTSPSLAFVGTVDVPAFATPPNAPAPGSAVPINAGDERMQNAVYRDGFLWTAHTVGIGGRAACRWYQLLPADPGLVQSGVIADASLHYYYPSLSVNQFGDMAIGFTGSHANQFASGYFTGRLAGDPPGETGLPILLKAGEASYTVMDDVGRNRWGDYSATTLDPLDETGFWTLQEYAGSPADNWSTWVGQLSFEGFDCNTNGQPDADDITLGTSSDCDSNGVPDECQPDCDANGVPDRCVLPPFGPDCNVNGLPDACDISFGSSADCTADGVLDECEPDCNANSVADSCDISGGTSVDCTGNGIPDECEPDCNTNSIADSCDVSLGTSADCNSNGTPDECDVAAGLYTAASGPLSPIGDSSPQTFVLIAPPAALGPVTLALTAFADLSAATEYLDVDINGVFVGRVFQVTGNDCPPAPDQAELLVPATTYNAAVGGANGSIRMRAFGGVNSLHCNSPTYVTVAVRYLAPRDCNGSGVPDDCDIAAGSSNDCDDNAVPDECQEDCNSNGISDACDLASGTSDDCDNNATPDECEDCNGNELADVCDIAAGTSRDCNSNALPDECDLASGQSIDCNANGTLDECDLAAETASDCNTNGTLDACDLAAGTADDCNSNSVVDDCEVELCVQPWSGFEPVPPFATGAFMHGIDHDADGRAWQNPSNSASVLNVGCSPTTPKACKVVSQTPPTTDFVVSEPFAAAGSPFDRQALSYSLEFDARSEAQLNPRIDWQLTVRDRTNDAVVILLHWASTQSNFSGVTAVNGRGRILVQNPAGSPTFINSGFAIPANSCYHLKVTSDDLTGEVRLYINAVLRVTTTRLNAGARRMSFFRLEQKANGQGAGGSNRLGFDNFTLCEKGVSVGPVGPPDCNGNGVLDECDTDCDADGTPDQCEAPAGDLDGDGDVDLADHARFVDCITGPCGEAQCDPPLYADPCCARPDLDADGDVDTADWAIFQDLLPN